ncbi:alkaline phosphatase family protein [Halorussus vallis]|uniref:alkaline phosphatase family protein n=2 Tax=Halorussus TaxID=1070314 RepID=UPI0020A10297|nr:alkaline phosphatase family protein [Halorussus vallis]USZ76629.1 alkaline phosphatase family protein [Halorussus vallis]
MLQDDVAGTLRERHLEGDTLFPAYEDYCFANVPDAVASVLGDDTTAVSAEVSRESRPRLPARVFDGVDTDVRNVAVVLLDGFGYDHWKRRHERHDLLADLTERGTVTPLTSIYPSETAAAITTMHTGRQPVEHGNLGWFQHLGGPDDGVVVQTLPFTTLDDEPVGEAFGDASPERIFEGDTLYRRLAASGVDPHVVHPAAIEGGAYSNRSLRGATTTPYENVAEMALRVRQTLEAADDPTYVYGYVPHLDAAGHAHGNDSPEYRAQIGMVADCLRRELVERLDPETARETLLIVTADHGQVDTSPEENVDLGELGVEEFLARDADGEPIRAVGGPRNLQFHTRPGETAALAERLAEAAPVRTFDAETLRDRGLFGDREPSATFERRRPDLVAVPERGMLWYDDGHFEHVGMHGGLHPTEMLVPFGAVRLDELQ